LRSSLIGMSSTNTYIVPLAMLAIALMLIHPLLAMNVTPFIVYLVVIGLLLGTMLVALTLWLLG
jgi:hypothetical protein